MAVTYTFSTQSGSIPLAQLDANFATPITIGNTSVQLGNTITTLNNITLANTTISSGNVTLTNVSVTTANVTTANITNAVIGTANITTANITSGVIATANITTGNVGTLTLTNALGTASGGTGLTSFTSGGVVYASSGSALTTGSALTWDGSTFYVKPTGAQFVTGATFAKIENLSGASASFIMADTTDSATIKNIASSLAFINSGTEGMRLTSTGLGIGLGGGSPATKLDVSYTASAGNIVHIAGANNVNGYIGAHALDNGGLYINSNQANQDLRFRTQNTDRATIDSSGNLLVGTADSGQTTGAGVKIRPSAASLSSVNPDSTNSTNTFHMYSTGAAAYRFYVGWGGTISATSATISAISDQRLKENIQDLDVGLNAVMALKPRKFDWKAGKGKDIKGDRGFIAQELEQVFPDLVDEWADPAPEGEEPYKSVRQDLIPVLVKAIQEQQALIQSLTDRIAQLEAK